MRRGRRSGTRTFLRLVFDAGPKNREKKAAMNVKRWILWVCLVLLFVSQVLLFRANQMATAAQADARDVRRQLEQAQAELTELKSSSVATLSLENARLRQENQSYSQKLAHANNELTQATAAKEKLAGQLQTARLALSMQQDHLQQLSTANQEAQAAPPPPPAPTISPEDALNQCLQNLRQIDAAKQSWAVDNSKDATDVPTVQDLLPYLKGNVLPVCPAGGIYRIGAMNEQPSCSIAGHALQ